MPKPPPDPNRPWFLANVRLVGGRLSTLKFQAKHLTDARTRLTINAKVAVILSIIPAPTQ